MPSSPAIELINLSKDFDLEKKRGSVVGLGQQFSLLDTPPALSGLNVKIAAGSITGLVGPDGAGKTTLLRILAGLLAPSGGESRVIGLDPCKEGEELRRNLGYMPQKFGLYEDLSVQENLDLYAELRSVPVRERPELFKRLLRFTGLQPFTARLAGRLSGGMKQKLGLACSLMGNPRILLLDEPSVGVDPISRRELWEMVRQLSGDGITVVWSTSYLDEAERCSNILLMNLGRLLYYGPPDALCEEMRGRSAQIQGMTADRRKVLQMAMNRPEVIDGVIQGRHVRLVLNEAGQFQALESVVAKAARELPEAFEKNGGSGLALVDPRLEDAFITRLGGGPKGDSALAALFREERKELGSCGEDDYDCLRHSGSIVDFPIEAEELTKVFGAFTATDHISFKVRRGEIFGLLGPNGAGKSTTFKMLCGLLAPSSGKARVMGLDLAHDPGRARQHLGYMAQKFSMYSDITVRQNLEFFAGVYGLDYKKKKARLREMTEVFNFGHYLDRPAGSLPLGYKQRLSLACAVMHSPDILFLDEPTSGVDPVTRREFWCHINGLVQLGVTILVTTHFMDEAEYCDRIGLVYRGRFVSSGTPDELKAQAATKEQPDPSLEDAFITLVERFDAANGAEVKA